MKREEFEIIAGRAILGDAELRRDESLRGLAKAATFAVALLLVILAPAALVLITGTSQ